MTRANTKACGVCQSTFFDGPCIHAPGGGTTDDPTVPDFNLNPADGNMVSKGPNGLMGRLASPYDNPPAALVYATLDQPIGFDAVQTLHFERTGYDTDAMHDPDDDTKLTFRTTGLYAVSLNVTWFRHGLDGVLGATACYLRTNGDLNVAVDAQHAVTSSGYARHSMHAIVAATTTGEYVEARAKHTLRVDAETPLNASILALRSSPIMTATFLRTLDDLTVFGR